MANNRELSQLASFVTVNDTSKTIAFGSTVASLNVAGVVTATTFVGDLNGNITGSSAGVNVTGVGTIARLEATNVNVSGIITATSFDGEGGIITSNSTFYVATTGNDTTGDGSSGSPWATPHKAMRYLQDRTIGSGATIGIVVADGSYTFTNELDLSHPQGHRIFISGGSLSGTKPGQSGNLLYEQLTGSGAGNRGNNAASYTANISKFQTYWGTEFNFNGCNGLVVKNGGNVLVDRVFIKGNTGSGSTFAGVSVGIDTVGEVPSVEMGGSPSSIKIGPNVGISSFQDGIQAVWGGSIYANDVVISNCAGTAVVTNFGGHIDAKGVVATNCGNGGFYVYNGGTIVAIGVTSSNNLSAGGLLVQRTGTIYAANSTISNNSSNIQVVEDGAIRAENSNCYNSGNDGVRINGTGSIRFTSGICTGNTGNGIEIDGTGYINCDGAQINNNSGDGISINGTGTVVATGASIHNNTSEGIFVSNGGSVRCDSSTRVSDNGGSADLRAINFGGIVATGTTTVPGLTVPSYSPPTNVIGSGSTDTGAAFIKY